MEIAKIKAQLDDTLVAVETFRKQKVATISTQQLFYSIPAVLVITFIILHIIEADLYASIIIIAAFITGGLVYSKVSANEKTIKQQFKDKVVSEIVQLLYPQTTYQFKEQVNTAILKQSKLAAIPPYQTSADYFKGTAANGNTFELMEYVVDKNDSGTTLFLSVALDTPLPKDSLILVIPNKMGNVGKLVAGTFNKYWNKTAVINFRDYPVFEEKYLVHATTTSIAKQYLTKTTIDKILKIEQKFKQVGSISLVENKVYVAIQNESNFFEFNIHNSLTADWVLRKLQHEITRCFELAEDFSQIIPQAPPNDAADLYDHLIDNEI